MCCNIVSLTLLLNLYANDMFLDNKCHVILIGQKLYSDMIYSVNVTKNSDQNFQKYVNLQANKLRCKILYLTSKYLHYF